MGRQRATVVLPDPRAKRSPSEATNQSSLTAARVMVVRGVRLALLVALAFGVGSVLFAVLGQAPWSIVQPVAVVSILIVVSMLALRAFAFTERATPRAILRAGLVYVVWASGLFAYAHAGVEGQVYGRVTGFGPFTLVIISFPLVIPASRRLTILTVFASTAVIVPAFYIADVTGLAVLPVNTYLETVLVQLICGAIAVLSSTSLDRLRRDAAQAARIGRYELVKQLGEGSMGEVWRARHDLLAREAAIKLIKPTRQGGGGSHKALTRFRREAQSTALLTSPHTVRLFDFGVTDQEEFYYVMELLEGMDLQALVRDHGRQPPGRVLEVLIQACDSLGEAHAKGLIHRDIKPANMMLCQVGMRHDMVKVLDFGVVALRPDAAIGTDSFLTGSASVGTPAYMAPEAISNDNEERSDLYSLGCVGYYLLTGQRVFAYENATKISIAHTQEAPVPPSERGVPLSPRFESALMRCLQKSPDARHPSAQALRAALIECRGDHPWTESQAAHWWAARGSEASHARSLASSGNDSSSSNSGTLADDFL